FRHHCILAVFNLNPRDDFNRGVAADDDIFRLADIDPGIRSAAHDAVLHQYVARLYRIDTISAVASLWPASPFDTYGVIDNPVSALGLDPVTLAVFNREIAQHHIVGGYQQPLARPKLSGQAKDA